jgi:hypothetical protein
MKKIFLLLVLFSLLGCEKDDICDPATATTPQLVIEFYNAANPTVKRNVTNLGVIAPGFSTGISFNAVSKIKIPLKTTENSTQLQFIQNGSDTNTTNDNNDVLNFTYTRNNVFVSRACGFKTLFDLTNTNSNLVTTDTDNWIDYIEIIQPKIETENETHIKVFF